MGRTARDNRDRPHPKPVERIELNDEHTSRRLIAAAVLLVFGAGLLVYAVTGFLSPDTGWQTIQAGTGGGATCGGEFTFLYEGSTVAEVKQVTNLYTDASRKAFQLFHSGQEFADVTNVTTINSHPNEVLEVDAGLYEAFAAVAASGRRELYLGPVYDRYDGLFYCQDDSQLVDFDPRLSEDVREEYAGILAYASDPQAIGLELLDGNRVRLNVSEAYLSWAEREGITKFIDFSWMRNAFIADYLAGELTAGGYTSGVLSSYDGFARNLDGGGNSYTLAIYDRTESGSRMAAEARYQGPMSIVSLWDYPLAEMDEHRFYQLENGEVRSLYLDPADALCRSAVHNLTGYARDKGCGEILLALAPVYIADRLEPEALTRLSEEGVETVFCQDRVIRYTDQLLELSQLYDRDGARYTAALLEP